MSDTPSYLGLLNAIAVAEAEAEIYLDRWAEATESDGVRQVIHTVALREGEHAKAFEKRICELGFELRTRDPDPVKVEIAGSTELSDRQKFEALNLGNEPDSPDVFSHMFDDPSIDIHTGGLLGRYIAEERDSGRMLRACYIELCHSDGVVGTDDPQEAMDAILDRLERIEKKLKKLSKKR